MSRHLQNARWTDLFIRRPVLAVTLATVIAVLGVYGLSKLTVREYPKLTSTVLTISTSYPGASPNTVQSYITQPLSRVLGSVPGLDYMTSSSSQGSSTITLNMKLNTNPDTAQTNALTKIKQVEALLPKNSFPPVVSTSSGRSTALMYIAFYSPDHAMNIPQIVDYVVRNVQPLLQTVTGVSEAQIMPPGASGGNGNNQAVRVWLNPVAMTAHDVTPVEVNTALAAQNVVAATGKTKGRLITIPLTSNLGLTSAKQFDNLVVKTVHGTPVYLKDVAKVELGAQSYTSKFYYNGKPAVAIGIQTTPSANSLNVALGVSQKLDQLKSHLPPGLKLGLPYNAATFIQSSIVEVAITIGITLAVVVLVIFLFLGSLRALLVPVVAIPLSLAGAGFFMYLSGYTYNLLTLLAFVLAIGLVVDDAIVMVENVHRHIEEGRSGFQAAVLSARELSLPIVVMSTTLMAVYLPVAFAGGLSGALFTEFAFTIVFAVIISMVVALTLSPVLSGAILRKTPTHGLNHFLNSAFDKLNRGFDRSLHSFLEFPSVGLLFVVATLVAVYLMFTGVRHELSPPQNSGIIFTLGTSEPDAAPGYLETYGKQVLGVLDKFPEKQRTFMVTGFSPTGAGTNSLIAGMQLKPFSERSKTASQLKPAVQHALGGVAGLKAAAFTPPPLPGSTGLFPIDFVITSAASYKDLDHIATQVLAKARSSGKFLFLQKNLKIDQPQHELVVNRHMASDLGISMSQIASSLQPMLSGSYVNRFIMNGYAYQVIPEAPMAYRDTTRALEQIHLRAANGALVPLSTLVSFKTKVIPESLPQFDRLNSVSIQGVPFPGVSEGAALGFLKQTTLAISPTASVNYAGASRQFIEQGNTFMISVALALVLIYLLLSAQFNSFRDALIVIFAVPMSAAGALLFMTFPLFGVTLNIYTQIALITLIGLITKQGILVVQFANDLQESLGLSLREAVEKAASIRLRPILMTTLSMAFGVIPLIIATGSGAPPRNQLGIVIAAGLGIGSLFSLYIVPVMYLYLSKDHARIKANEDAQQRDLDRLAAEEDSQS
ncbi:efflux RND transporter permease subunit [Acidihalobacter ferrooxydans]|uniref:Multidrug efflux protein n=1 Tax=Acidihalobacter ferrooxydans TaxID=1765967 RepID=A0A1P8UHG4_9GAMM|nr:efflux RND transporter permease subunit [Acidihalobacter ferrooxydans]APZ43201.1 multidrug efflux protein [Acidihalobacter ferrooxydans]